MHNLLHHTSEGEIDLLLQILPSPLLFFTVAVDLHSTFFTLTLLYLSTTIFLPHNHSFYKVVLKGSKDIPPHR